MPDPNLDKHLPLSESTFYILLSLGEPRHGYGVMQRVAELSEGTVAVGPGTLYGAFCTLEKQGFIRNVREEDRRKYYELTEAGRELLAAQLRRVEIMARRGRDRLPG